RGKSGKGYTSSEHTSNIAAVCAAMAQANGGFTGSRVKHYQTAVGLGNCRGLHHRKEGARMNTKNAARRIARYIERNRSALVLALKCGDGCGGGGSSSGIGSSQTSCSRNGVVGI
ncbi:MAG: hypothetical protein ABGW82_06140, partial [Paracoccus sp. (in: a-proteobacteria)]